MSRVIPGVLAEVIRKAPLCQEKIEFAWSEAVGATLTRVTRVRLGESGVLHVSAEGQWGREIRRLSPIILRRLEALLGSGTVSTLAVEPSSASTSHRTP